MTGVQTCALPISQAAGADANEGVDRGALTVGANYLFNLNTLLKFELRRDWATGEVFKDVKSGAYRKSNNLISTAVVVSF